MGRKKDTNPIHHYAIRPGPMLHAEVVQRIDTASRGTDKMNKHRAAKRDLLRYYTMLNETRAALDFDALDASIICVALKGAKIEAAESAWMAFDAAIGPKPSADDSRISKRLRRLNAAESTALVDAVERYWLRHPKDASAQPSGLVAVGLMREPELRSAAAR